MTRYPFGTPLHKMDKESREEWKSRYYPVIARLKECGVPDRITEYFIGFPLNSSIRKGIRKLGHEFSSPNKAGNERNILREARLSEVREIAGRYQDDPQACIPYFIKIWRDENPDKDFGFADTYFPTVYYNKFPDQKKLYIRKRLKGI